MFSGPKFLAYTQKPSVYQLRKLMTDSEREGVLKKIVDQGTRALKVSPANPVYQSAYQKALKEV